MYDRRFWLMLVGLYFLWGKLRERAFVAVTLSSVLIASLSYVGWKSVSENQKNQYLSASYFKAARMGFYSSDPDLSENLMPVADRSVFQTRLEKAMTYDDENLSAFYMLFSAKQLLIN